jgi:L-alanine-DL-glutamate epimerase-like enolase superfamily enzyme
VSIRPATPAKCSKPPESTWTPSAPLPTAPVIIESVDLLRLGNNFLCRVRSRDGAEGISVAHSGMSTLFPIFLRNLQPFFLGKDARELDLILDKVYIYNFNFRFNGMALGLPLATIEFAILDMLGRIAKKPVGQLIGDIHNPEVGVYVATEWREKPVEESIELIRKPSPNTTPAPSRSRSAASCS